MRTSVTLSLCAAVLLAGYPASTAEAPSPNEIGPIQLELRDQFGAARKFSLPATNITVMAIADRKGAEQIAGWIAPVKRRFDDQIQICGIADLSSVPRFLRGMVRKRFENAQDYPIMLDWSGDAVKAFGCEAGKANILALGANGRVLHRATGAASPAAVEKLCDSVARDLARPEASKPPMRISRPSARSTSGSSTDSP